MTRLRQHNEQDMVELVTEARLFLMAGGKVTLTEWRQLDAQERGALSAAGYRLAVELLVKAGRAAHGPLEACREEGDLDGGKSYCDALVEEAMDGFLEGMSKIREDAVKLRRVE